VNSSSSFSSNLFLVLSKFVVDLLLLLLLQCKKGNKMVKVAMGQADEFSAPDALKGALAEFISLFLFVFIGAGSVLSYQKVHVGETDASGLIVVALAHGFALAVLVAATANISGGHVNPAVSLGLALAGQITIIRLVLYWIAQILGAIAGAWVLQLVSTGEVVPIHTVGVGESLWGAVLIEIVLTFALVFVVFATAADPKKGPIGTIAPLAIGFTVLAGILVAAPFSGASLNPARSFGPAVVAWNWTNQWVYWVGPFIGAAIAALIYDGLFLSPAPPATHTPVSSEYN
jgi:aquaporin TIP